MEISKIIKTRKSVRNYVQSPIPEQDLYEMLSAGLYAPSGKNRQPWRFLVIKDGDKIRQISKTTKYNRFIRTAPILVLIYLILSNEYPIEKDILSVGACVQNILLTATEMGYGTCVIGELYSKQLEVIDIKKDNYKLICGITFGKANAENKISNIKELNEYLIEF